MSRTVFFIGNHAVPTSTESSYGYAFERNGWKVERVQQETAHHLGPAECGEWVKACDAALLVYVRTHNHTALTSDWTELWRALEDRGIQTASVHLDVFFGIPEREQWISDGDPLFSTGTVFTADGRVTSERAFFEAGVNHVWLPPAIDERNLLPADTQFEPCEGLPPIVWVGSSRYHEEWPWRAELVDFLRTEYGSRLIEFGNGSPQGSCRDNATLTSLYASDSIVVGDSMFATNEENGYYSDRVPEVMGRGGFLLHPSLPSDFFPNDSYVKLLPNNTQHLGWLIDGCLSPDAWPSRILRKENAHRHIRFLHTYTRRAQAILLHLGLSAPVNV